MFVLTTSRHLGCGRSVNLVLLGDEVLLQELVFRFVIILTKKVSNYKTLTVMEAIF